MLANTVVQRSVELNCGVCRLRPFRNDDAVSIARHANNPNIAANLRDRFPHPYTIEDAYEFLDRVNRGSHVTLAIEVNGDAVGAIGIIFGDDIERCTAELGYWLGEEFWNHGITTAAIRNFTAWAFREFPLTRIYAKPFVENQASCHVLEKAGYTREAVLRKAAIKRGASRDFVLYAVVR